MNTFLDIAQAILGRSRVPTRGRGLGHRARVYARARERGYKHDYIFTHASDHIPTYILDHALAHAYHYTCRLAENLKSFWDRAFTHVHDFPDDYYDTLNHLYAPDRARIEEKYDTVRTLCQEQGLNDLHEALNQLSLPSIEAPFQTWKDFSIALFELFKTHRSLEDYTFTKEQAEHLVQYFKATTSALDCLNGAAISDQAAAAIEDRLLRPPQSSPQVTSAKEDFD